MTKRWNQTNEKILSKWRNIFQEKFQEFQDDVWTLTAITTNLPSPDEWEFLLEERVGMALKCKVCNHVWVTDHGLVCFYYNNPSGETEGKVLVWLKPVTCPMNNENCCSSSTVPLIDVYPDEMEAVLYFLKMQIGWLFYQRQYSKDDEKAIEKQRILREKKTKKNKIKHPSTKKAISPEVVQSTAIAPFTEPASYTTSANTSATPAGSRVPPQPAQAAKEKTKQNKKKQTSAKKAISPEVVKSATIVPFTEPTSYTTSTNTSAATPAGSRVPPKPAQAAKRVTKLKNRWDKSHKEIINEWNVIFEGKFSEFTLKCPSDKWVMTMDKVIKNHPLRREKKWQRFLGEQSEVGFKCEKCNYVWESKRGWISFWIWQNPPNIEGERIGEVVVHVLGQKCANCPGNSDNKPYWTGDLQGEHIDAVLSALFMEIDYWYYGNESYTDWDEKVIDDKLKGSKPPFRFGRGEHKKGSCQACREKVCKQTVTAVFPNPPYPPNP